MRKENHNRTTSYKRKSEKNYNAMPSGDGELHAVRLVVFRLWLCARIAWVGVAAGPALALVHHLTA